MLLLPSSSLFDVFGCGKCDKKQNWVQKFHCLVYVFKFSAVKEFLNFVGFYRRPAQILIFWTSTTKEHNRNFFRVREKIAFHAPCSRWRVKYPLKTSIYSIYTDFLESKWIQTFQKFQALYFFFEILIEAFIF